MEALLLTAAFVSFILFLVPGRHGAYAGIAGWLSMSLFLFAEVPHYLSINNFLYPILAVLSIPFMYVTARRLLAGDANVQYLTRAAAVAVLVYLPFAYTSLGDWLIGVVTGEVGWLLNLVGVQVSMYDWNMFIRNGLRVEIILGCTGIQSIAIMLGVAAAVPTDLRQKILAVLVVVPTIYILNLLRNVFVITAYTGQWFPYFPEIASNGEFGYESFFWAHNVLCELGALIALVIIAYALFALIPDLGRMAGGLYQAYRDDLTRVISRDR
ncbi:archaeosortase A [Methanofollis formosanus]|uniref:Archaeosortase A n=1 Tax=Methanofollis formosanus TaxID=299308 RepID=A0A8G1A028_9EURY|nr:archaeosortase A [Methanofollis formosanus]QYZ78575.1 archaeosortase A [Methanofollis formosanus]